jgi:hypothetical protein
MFRERVLAVVAGLCLVSTGTAAAQGAPSTATVRGEVIDSSGAVVPGATVEALRSGGAPVYSAVTDARGVFTLTVTPGPLTLRMTLDGFEPASLPLVVESGVDTWVAGLLRIAALSERVVVLAPAPEPTLVTPPPPPPPRHEVVPVPLPDMESVCGPSKPRATTVPSGSIGAHRADPERILYRLGDELRLEPAAGFELLVGQNLVARRHFRAAGARGAHVRGEHTAGVVQVVTVSDQAVTAIVIYACGEIRRGDLLMPFVPEPMPEPEPAGVPVYREAARILFGDTGQLMGAPGRLMVIDRGRLQGVRPGQRLTLFRRGRGGRETVVGEAVVLGVREDSARIRVESATDAIWAGDSAAPQTPVAGHRAAVN